MLHPVVDPLQRGTDVRDRNQTNVVAPEGRQECFSHAAALGAFDRREAVQKVQGRGNVKRARLV